MRRRDFITLVGTAATWPLAARAQQQSGMPVIGFLDPRSPDALADRLRAFHRGLKDAGYIERENVAIEYRWAENQMDRLPALAAELVRLRVGVIVSPGGSPRHWRPSRQQRQSNWSIWRRYISCQRHSPRVILQGLSRPEGNVTGISSLNVDVTPKGLELMHQLMPQSKSFSVLVNPANQVNFAVVMKDLEDSSRTLGLQLHILNASTDAELEAAFARQSELGGGLIISADIFFNSRPQQLAALTLKHAVPAVHTVREFAASGGLMSYGGNIRDTHKQAGIYTGRILKGAKPADLPVQQATKVELYINLKTAKTLGIAVPLPLSGRADELFE